MGPWEPAVNPAHMCSRTHTSTLSLTPPPNPAVSWRLGWISNPEVQGPLFLSFW